MNLLLALVTWNIYAWIWQSGWQNEGALIFYFTGSDQLIVDAV
ncbi:MAG: hypothetical protein CM15mP120_20270 [Pseudomonadota bacterium]|nr:MAG: hypothetical protein CM15mP120_20270 [Pseudomonadota bacterium]